MPTRRCVLTAVLGALFLATASPARGDALDADGIRTLIAGNTVIGPIGAQLYDFSYEPDGNLYGSIGTGSDSGRWSISDDGIYCHEWSTYFDGERRCYRWVRAGRGRFRMLNVDRYRTRDIDVWRIEPGLQ